MDGAPLAPAPAPPEARAGDPPDLAGQVLDDRYRLEAKIGSGGMGVVYRATHTVIGKEVAVKILREEHVAQADIMDRFLQEARLASQIRHPNVVEISDFGRTPSGGAYYVMEMLHGHSLAWRIDRGERLGPRRALEVAAQVASGLGAAHALGVIHRDLKPDNVFLCESPMAPGGLLAKILDFGIARVVGRKTRITKMGAVVGTPEYMSPEQARGEEVDHRSDLYALGVILFEMLVGRVPFQGDTVMGTLTRQMFDVPPRLSEAGPGLAGLAATERLLARLLAKNRDERPVSAEHVARLLSEAGAADLSSGPLPAGPRRTVALGSGTMEGDQATGHVERGRAPSWPRPAAAPAVAQASGAAWSEQPTVDLPRPATPAEFMTPAELVRAYGEGPGAAGEPPGDSSGDLSDVGLRLAPRRAPIALVVLGVAVLAGGATFGAVRWGLPALRAAREAPAPSPSGTTPAAAVPTPQEGSASSPSKAATPGDREAPAEVPSPSSAREPDEPSPSPEGAAPSPPEAKAEPATPAATSAHKAPRRKHPRKPPRPKPTPAPAAEPPGTKPGPPPPRPASPRPPDPSTALGDLKDPFDGK